MSAIATKKHRRSSNSCKWEDKAIVMDMAGFDGVTTIWPMVFSSILDGIVNLNEVLCTPTICKMD